MFVNPVEHGAEPALRAAFRAVVRERAAELL
jgi:hypothetical protein